MAVRAPRRLREHPSLVHFVETYGEAELRAFLEDAQAGRSGAHTARRLGVSRERVSQWRAAWLRQEIRWAPTPELERHLQALGRRRSR